MKKQNKILLIISAVLLAAAVIFVILMVLNPSAPAGQSTISMVENSGPEETEAEPDGTDPRKIEAETTEPTGPSYPVVELDVPPIERIDTDILLEAEAASYTGLLASCPKGERGSKGITGAVRGCRFVKTSQGVK